jgi:hypothetical protein
LASPSGYWHRVPGVTTLRRLGFAFWLTRARLARRGERFLLVGLGVAAAAAMLAAVIAGARAAEDRDVGRQVAGVDAGSRSIHVTWFSAGGQAAPYATFDSGVRRSLRRVTSRPATATSLYRESQLGGAFLGLGAVDDLGRWVRLRSGRLPRPCTLRRCEVLVVRRGGRIPDVPGLRLVPVGEGDVVSATLFGEAVPSLGLHQSRFVQEMARYHRPAPPPLVLANGVAGLDRWPRLRDAYRTYSWVIPLDRRLVRSWSVDSLARRIERVRSELQAQVFGFYVEAPTDELRAAADSGRVVSRRLFLLGGEAVALLLAFAVLAGARLRPDVEASRARLVSSGARGWQIWLQTVLESAAPAVAGSLLGWAVGAAAAVVVANRAGEPVWGILRHSVLSGGGIAAGLLLAAGSAFVLALTLAVRPLSLGGLSLTPLDVAALGAVVAVAVALARGAADASALLSGNGTGVVLLLLPVLVAFAAAIAVARLLPPVLRALENAVPRRVLSLRLASLALARRPGYAAVAVGFVVVSVGLALFAETYRWTLVRGQHDQAFFAVPADFVLSEDFSRLIPVRAAVTPKEGRSLRPAEAEPVLRAGGTIQGAAALGNIAVLGLEPGTLARIGGWRSDFASHSPSQLAQAVAWHGPAALRGAPLPRTATRLVLPVRVLGTKIGVVALVRRPNGSFATLTLGHTRGSRPRRLVSTLPPATRGGSLVAFRFIPPPRLIERGGDQGGPAVGTVSFGRPLAVTPAGAVEVTEYADWRGTAGVQGLTRDGGVRFRLTLSPQVDTYLRPRQPTDGRALPAVVSPRLRAIAGRNGVFGVQIAGQGLLFRVAAVARRFPSATSQDTTDFVVADRDAVETALNASQPGSGLSNELWLNVPPARLAAVADRLRRPPFDVLAVTSRAELERRLRRDPVARAAVAMLEVSSVTALVLALVGLGLGVVSERRDEAADLFDLEAQGLAPASLRRQLRLRALAVGLGGVVGGVLTALVLSLLVVGFVELTANAGVPNPPLVLALDWPVVLLSGLGGVVLAAALIAFLTARSFRGQTPGRYGEGSL